MGGVVSPGDKEGMVGKRQVGIGIHTEKQLLLALQGIARPKAIFRGVVGGDDPFRWFGAAFGLENVQFRL
jgi:hypothetical protein